MNDSLVKKNYLKKIKLFQKYNKFYFNEDKSIVTDQEFDLLKRDIID